MRFRTVIEGDSHAFQMWREELIIDATAFWTPVWIVSDGTHVHRMRPMVSTRHFGQQPVSLLIEGTAPNFEFHKELLNHEE